MRKTETLRSRHLYKDMLLTGRLATEAFMPAREQGNIIIHIKYIFKNLSKEAFKRRPSGNEKARGAYRTGRVWI